MRTQFLITLVCLAACGGKNEGTATKLVEAHCSELIIQLEEAATSYNAFAGSLATNKLEGDDLKRAQSKLPFGATFEQRAPTTLQLMSRLGLCTQIREGGSELMGSEYSGVFQTFRESNDPAESARAVAQMLAHAKKLSTMPLKK